MLCQSGCRDLLLSSGDANDSSSTCCNYACSGSYNEDGTFLGREDGGMFYIRLHLDGMNFDPEPVQVAASYGSWEYLDITGIPSAKCWQDGVPFWDSKKEITR